MYRDDGEKWSLPLLLGGITSFVLFFFNACWQEYQFDINCANHLKMAGDAGTPTVAAERLDKALKYLEYNGLTRGTTALFFDDPTRDIGVWYSNLKQEQETLLQFPKNASETDRATRLMKLREVVLDHVQSGIKVTVPGWIELYPFNGFYFGWGVVSLGMIVIGGIKVGLKLLTM